MVIRYGFKAINFDSYIKTVFVQPSVLHSHGICWPFVLQLFHLYTFILLIRLSRVWNFNDQIDNCNFRNYKQHFTHCLCWLIYGNGKRKINETTADVPKTSKNHPITNENIAMCNELYMCMIPQTLILNSTF